MRKAKASCEHGMPFPREWVEEIALADAADNRPMNRLEQKLGRECTDFDFDAQQILLERAQKEIRHLKAALWAIAWSAPKHRITYSPIDADPYDERHVITTWANDHDMTVTIQAEHADPLKAAAE